MISNNMSIGSLARLGKRPNALICADLPHILHSVATSVPLHRPLPSRQHNHHSNNTAIMGTNHAIQQRIPGLALLAALWLARGAHGINVFGRPADPVAQDDQDRRPNFSHYQRRRPAAPTHPRYYSQHPRLAPIPAVRPAPRPVPRPAPAPYAFPGHPGIATPTPQLPGPVPLPPGNHHHHHPTEA